MVVLCFFEVSFVVVGAAEHVVDEEFGGDVFGFPSILEGLFVDFDGFGEVFEFHADVAHGNEAFGFDVIEIAVGCEEFLE